MKRGLALSAILLVSRTIAAYPTDQFERTHIRRLDWQRAVDAGSKPGRKDPPGAQWPAERIELKMRGAPELRLTAETPKDAALQAGLEAALKKLGLRSYNAALLDLTDPTHPRYAGVHEQVMQNPGSVAKLLIAAGLLRALADRFPTDLAAREAFLRDTFVTADEWAMPNSHEVPVIDGERVAIRAVRKGDRFSLWEWLDHALSPSSNAAASVLWREVTLMRLLGADYPPPAYDAALFARWDKHTFSEAAFAAVDRSLADAGLDPAAFQLRLFFTKGPSKYVERGDCHVSPLALVQWMLAVEQGRMVDAWSSLELKRMLYLTRRRVRYAQAAELNDAAVFFKSGSLWQCKPEEGYVCTQYQGNEVNVLNALVEVEAAGAPPAPTLVYIVAVMSNELKRNAADDHGKLASSLHRLLQLR